MKIGVVSDTHVPSVYSQVPQALWMALAPCDLVIHAGDFDSWETYLEFKKRFSVVGVIGNRDTFPKCEAVPEKRILEVGGVRIGITHGFGPRKGIPQRILATWNPGPVDLIIHGHSHSAGIETVEGVRFLNPGSATDLITADRQTYAILEVDGSIEISIHDLLL